MKIERKYMAHYLNTVFAGDTGTAAYVRLGKDLEEYSPELSANVEKKSNIMGETSVTIDSYQKQGEVDRTTPKRMTRCLQSSRPSLTVIWCWMT